MCAPGIHAKASSIGGGGKLTTIRPSFVYSGIPKPKYLDKLKNIDYNALQQFRNEHLIK